jgi:hypothetical protein
MPKLFIGGGWVVAGDGRIAEWAMLVPDCIVLSLLSLILVEKNSPLLHAFTSTPTPLVHGAMLSMCKKTPLPHRNSQRKTKQKQKATAANCCLVEF